MRHGLAPKAGGGYIEISVVAGDGALCIEVNDNGVGLRESSGSGLGLAAVRARLRSAFGARGVLQVAPRAGGGVRAAVHVPQAAAHG